MNLAILRIFPKNLSRFAGEALLEYLIYNAAMTPIVIWNVNSQGAVVSRLLNHRSVIMGIFIVFWLLYGHLLCIFCPSLIQEY